MIEKLAAKRGMREPCWTEAIAVGDRDWLNEIYRRFNFKRKKILSLSMPYHEPQEYDQSGHLGGELTEAPAIYYIEG